MTTPRPLVRPARVLAAALAAGTLFATAACSGSDSSASPESDASSTVAERGLAAQTTSPAASSPAASESPSDLSEEGARNALITPADIEDDWTQVRDPREWRDTLLVGSVDVAAFVDGQSDVQDCQRLVDALFDETLLGKPTGASAVTGFQEGDSRLLYQVAAYDKAELDDSMQWLSELPDTCDQFTLTGGDAGNVRCRSSRRRCRRSATTGRA